MTFRVGLGAPLPPVSADRPFKHLRRDQWLQALQRARTGGWDEAILPDQAGRVVEGCVSNLFFVRDGCLHTPAEALGPLPGIMRGRVLALAGSAGLVLREGAYEWAGLDEASELWLSNSLIGLRAATCLGERPLPEPKPALDRIRAAWRDEYGWDPVVVATA
jgi:branched-subunit amino acid aminotransferase/4-amino-4-deoxychorismate lyase